jgi:cytochrome c-type protein NapB
VSTQIRASRRAFNGAPPVIPHAVENTSDAACYACHGQGMGFAGAGVRPCVRCWRAVSST